MAMFYKLFIIRLNCWPKDTTLQFTCRRMNWGTSQPRQAVVSSAKPLVGISVWRHSHPAAPIPLMPTMQFCKAVQRHISGHCSGCRRKRKILLLSGVFLTVDRFPCPADVVQPLQQHMEGIAHCRAEAVGRESLKLVLLQNL